MEKRNPNSENAVLVTTYPNILLYNLYLLTYKNKQAKIYNRKYDTYVYLLPSPKKLLCNYFCVSVCLPTTTY